MHKQQVCRSLRRTMRRKCELPDQKSHRYLPVPTRTRRGSVLGLPSCRSSSRLQTKSVRREYTVRGDQPSASLHLCAGLQRFAFGWVSSRVRERQRVPSTSRLFVVVQVREPLQMRRERGMPSREPSREVYLSENMGGKSVRLVSTGVHRPLRVLGGQTRLPVSKMRESLRRRLRSERRLQPTRYHTRL